MTTITYSADATTKIVGTTSDEDFTFTVTDTYTPFITEDKVDRVDKTVFPLGAFSDFKINAVPGPKSDPCTFYASAGDCLVSSEGHVSRVSNMNVSVVVQNKTCVRRVDRNLSGYVTIGNWKAGSLTKHIDDAIKAMISGKTANATTLDIYTTATGGTAAPNYVRNPSLFTGGLGMEATSCSMDNDPFEAVLISPLHVMTSHIFPVAGGNIVFKDSAGNYQTRTITNVSAVGCRLSASDPIDYSGFAMGKLSAPITTIEPLTIVPANLHKYIPSLNSATDNEVGIPALAKQHVNGTRMRIKRLSPSRMPTEWYTVGTGTYGVYLAYPSYSDENYNAWSSSIISGDSNSPTFLPINGKAVLMTLQWQASGSNQFNYMIPEINAVMTALGGGYQATHPDLSMFNTY